MKVGVFRGKKEKTGCALFELVQLPAWVKSV